MRVLAISGSLRSDFQLDGPPPRAARGGAGGRRGRALGRPEGRAALRPGRRRRAGARGSGRGVPRARARGRRGLLRDARVQLVGPGRAQERARLGLAPARDERVPQQAGRGDQLQRRRLRRRLGGRRAPQGARGDGCRASPRPSWRSGTRTRSSTTRARLVDDDVRRGLREALDTLLAEALARRGRGLGSVSSSTGGSSSASRRCTTERESTPTSFPSSTTGTRS